MRGLGLIENLDDIRKIVVASHNSTPVYVKDLGTVQVANAFRTAALVKDTGEAVGGVVVARPDIKVIMTSAFSEEMVRATATAPQIRGFVRKPFQFEDLLKTLQSSLSS